MTDQQSPSASMSCQEVVELVTDYLDDALPAPLQQRFEEHLASCRGCRALLAQMRQTIQVTQRLSEADLSPAAREALLAAFRHWRQRS